MISLDYEKQYPAKIICGCDEVGRGPLAGSVVACAVIPNFEIAAYVPIIGVNDSKKLSAKKREELSGLITSKYKYAIGEASVEEIDEINILNATKLAIIRAVASLEMSPDIILVDGNMKFPDEKYKSIIKGDQKSYSIACASIVAKVYRDKMMKELALSYPHYGFEKNVGYGTKSHLEAIKEHGLTILHRKSFCRKLLSTPIME